MTPLLFILLVTSARSVTLPQTFKICNRRQSNLTECLREAAEFNVHQLIHPFKDLRLPGLKPLLIPSMTIGSGKRAVNVEQHFKDCHLHGLDHVEFDNFEFEFKKKMVKVDARFPEITKKCNYRLNGKVLLLPINGEGESTIVLRNMKIEGFLQYREVRRSGKIYLAFDSHNLGLDVGHVYYHFDNLFNGDKELGDTLNKVLNDNWKEVFDDVKANYAEVISAIIQSLFNKFFARVSLEDAFDQEVKV